MLSQTNRLKLMRDFEILFNEGNFIGEKFITAKIWRINPEKYPKRNYLKDDLKIGFAVGKKISKSAVKRNRIKRQMREVVRLLLKEDKIKKGFFVVFIAKPEILGCKYEEIKKDIFLLLQKMRILK
jgi:ribonuclease P protein component